MNDLVFIKNYLPFGTRSWAIKSSKRCYQPEIVESTFFRVLHYVFLLKTFELDRHFHSILELYPDLDF